jgi:hypothetical protein
MHAEQDFSLDDDELVPERSSEISDGYLAGQALDAVNGYPQDVREPNGFRPPAGQEHGELGLASEVLPRLDPAGRACGTEANLVGPGSQALGIPNTLI